MTPNFNIEQSTQLLEGQSHVWHQVFTFLGSMSLKCATELGIPDIIHAHGRPMSLDDLVSSLQVSADKVDGVYRLMRILVHSGFFKKERVSSDEGDVECYALTPSSLILVESHPYSLKPFVLSQLDPVIVDQCQFLARWLKNDDFTPCQTAYGMSYWEKKESEPEFSRAFDQGMASDTPLLSYFITRDCKHVFEGLNSIVDVGGGTGTLAKAIVDTFPHIHCTVLDLPHVVEGLRGDRNLKYVGGSMFDHIPQADAILMKCKEAISASKAEGRKLIIIEMTVDDKITIPNAHHTHLFLDMLMMILVRGRERTEKEWAKLFSDAGFSNYNITHISGIKSIIEVFL